MGDFKISDLTATNKFTVKCYLHFISLENPEEFIDHLVKEGNGY